MVVFIVSGRVTNAAEHFLLLLLHIKRVQLTKHGVAFVVKQLRETV